MYSLIGRILYKVFRPVLYLFLKRSRRVRVLMLYEGEVLLVRNWLSSQKWTVPGGGINKSETQLQAAKRELHEEIGLNIEETDFIALGEYDNSNFVSDCFLYQPKERCHILRNKAELIDANWFKVKNLPEPINPIVAALIERLPNRTVE